MVVVCETREYGRRGGLEGSLQLYSTRVELASPRRRARDQITSVSTRRDAGVYVRSPFSSTSTH